MSEAQLLTAPEAASEPARRDRRQGNYLASAGVYVCTILVCLLVVYFVLDLRHADLTVPLRVGGDTNVIMAGVKNLVENGGWYTNRFLGAPGQSELYDFPFFYGFNHLLVMKFLGLFTSNYVVVLNLYFLLSFPLAAVTGLFALRRLGISAPAAVTASVLFAMVPYHFFRGEGHFFLSLYYVVPLAVMVAMWVGTGEELFRFRRGVGFVSRKGAAAIAICVLMTIDNVYYAFFCAWLLIIAAGFAKFRNGRRGAVLSTGILLTVVVLTFATVMLPNMVYSHNHGHNRSVGARSAADSETFGLKLAQLVLPAYGHRVPAMATLKNDYNAAPLVTENDVACLGLVGSCGFLLLLAWVFFGRGGSREAELLSSLGALNLGAFVFATIGGLGSLFALLVTAEMRGLNRISIVIAFLSLFAVAVAADAIRHRIRGRAGMAAWYGGIVLILLVGMFDQTTEGMAPAHAAMRTQFAIYADFMKQIESSVPANTMIFQLPYMAFPETPAIHKMGDYDPLLGYLHSRTLRWSYGAMRGRPGDAVIREIAGKPVEQMVNAVLLAGFRGIYIDRFGYEDDANNLEARLGQVLGVKPIVSSDGRLSYFSLNAADVKLRSKYTSAELQVLRDAALGIVPLSVTLEPSCWPLEGTADNNWHWCPSQGKWLVSNKTPAPKRVRLDMTVATGFNEASNLRLVSPWLTKDIRTSAIGTPLQLSLTIPPGDYTMEFKSDAKTVHVTGELRPLVFQVKNFHLATIPDQAP